MACGKGIFRNSETFLALLFLNIHGSWMFMIFFVLRGNFQLFFVGLGARGN